MKTPISWYRALALPGDRATRPWTVTPRASNGGGLARARVAPAHRRVLAPPPLPRFARFQKMKFSEPDRWCERSGERVHRGAVELDVPTSSSSSKSAAAVGV